ncbi:hypothetical protein [Winogradskyella schleiferi]|uniref:hypothetical protein n=1 Tax=Winogradskyella schleiferi TaxID=2686078 RepID=UPI0015BBDAFC|nr:hypothetical protein [Winogradskyella schleiferi]
MKKVVTILCAVVVLFGCSNTTDDGFNNINGPQDSPTGVTLVFPSDDTLCNEGTNLTPTESTVYFEWQPNDNAETYTLSIENLSTGTIEQYDTLDFIFPVTIDRAEAYRWFVNYELQGEIKESAIWNFYNAGPGVQTYAPFPAEIISPSMAQTLNSTTSVTLEWSGSDVDNDIVSYDVYFGTEIHPSITASDISANQFTVSVASGTIYYWNIITKDAEGNTSESGVHQFSVLD